MRPFKLGLALVLSCLLPNCTDDDSAGSDRGGPDALTGFTWITSLTQNGINFDFGFKFTETTLDASNVCTLGGQSLTAKVSTPVKYRYSATVPKSGRSGDAACFVEVAASSFDFELVGNKLVMKAGGQTIEFTANGARSGLYGEWTAMANGFDLVWSMGNGKINAKALCPGGKTASVAVAATFRNFVDILEAKQDQVGDESFNCSVGIDQAMAEYNFAGDDLVMTIAGKSTTFSRK